MFVSFTPFFTLARAPSPPRTHALNITHALSPTHSLSPTHPRTHSHPISLSHTPFTCNFLRYELERERALSPTHPRAHFHTVAPSHTQPFACHVPRFALERAPRPTLSRSVVPPILILTVIISHYHPICTIIYVLMFICARPTRAHSVVLPLFILVQGSGVTKLVQA
jgi:hypothetical protein